jgi:hypothetical protein
MLAINFRLAPTVTSSSLPATNSDALTPSVFSGLAALSGCPAELITQLTSDWQSFI